ncbi:MAG: bifunctional oligoribonuclease/PAP phosphatase NrnA [Solobacterium sp.]|nr:bifunctional oligoribonuclease/PAP phosphatase NrnA [Solobacterium sp.]
MSFNQIVEQIKNYDTITIFRHLHPDCDALGSQFGLKTWIQQQFPEKQVYALGYETSTQGDFPALDTLEDERIKKSLAIVVDTSGPERVDDDRFLQAEYVIKIDHHPDLDYYGHVRYVLTKAAATCEILTDFFYEYDPRSITKEVAYYLYQGLLTDSLCFRTANTTSNTLKCASILAQQDLDIPYINRMLFDHSLSHFYKANYIRQHVQIIDDQFAYVLLSKEELKQLDLVDHMARHYIDEIGQVTEFKIWCIFTELEDEDGLYDGSLRSKTIQINHIASAYNGGGHANACGVNHINRTEIDALIADLRRAIANE